MSDHAKLSPSGAHRWMHCPASPRLEAPYPNTSNIHADTGTVAHDVGAKCLEFDKEATSFQHTIMPKYEHIPIDKEMVDNVQVYVDDIRSRAEGKELLVEQRVDFSRWVPEGFGTSDVVILGDGVMEIHDLKYGMRKVEAEGNEQLCLYALGAYNQFSMLGDFHSVKMVIHQPRLDHISEAELLIEDLLEFGERAKICAEICSMPDAEPIAGEKQCHWCRAKVNCPAAAKLVADTMGMDFENLTSDEIPIAEGPELTNEQLPAVYTKLDFIESWCSSIRGYVYEALRTGEKIAGYKMVTGKRGNRAFRDEDEAIKIMKGMRLKVDEMYDRKLKSPAKMEKLLKKDKPGKWEKIVDLITQSEGKPVVALESDKREAIGAVADDFDEV